MVVGVTVVGDGGGSCASWVLLRFLGNGNVNVKRGTRTRSCLAVGPRATDVAAQRGVAALAVGLAAAVAAARARARERDRSRARGTPSVGSPSAHSMSA